MLVKSRPTARARLPYPTLPTHDQLSTILLAAVDPQAMTGCVSEEPTHCQGINRPTLRYLTLNQLSTILLTAVDPSGYDRLC